MPRYLAINGQNEVGASALLKQGFVAHTEEFRETVAAVGGTVEGYWWASNGELVVLMNFDEPVNFALPALRGMASGTWLANAQLTQLYDGEDMDAEVARQAAAYVPPGSS